MANLEDLIDPEYGLQQDEWSLTRPRFGAEGQLEVIGWSGKGRWNHKKYVVLCKNCSEDSELFGEGLFIIVKNNLVRGAIPCGCSTNRKWMKDEYEIICKRLANCNGFMFKGFTGKWLGNRTRVEVHCPVHGKWGGATIQSVVANRGCPLCGDIKMAKSKLKDDDDVTQTFFNSGAFHEDTIFKRAGDKKCTWSMVCPRCGFEGRATAGNLQRGCTPCYCSKHNQKIAYINLVRDEKGECRAIKFGITNKDPTLRASQQSSKSVFNIINYMRYDFESRESCRSAEQECLREITCGVIEKEAMLDGWSETVDVKDLDKIISIYEKHGGKRIK